MRPPAAGGWARQTRATVGTGGALLVAAGAWTGWRATGSRLALFVCFAALIALVLDLGLAVVATRRVKATVDDSPTDAFVGDSVAFTLSVAGPRLAFRVRAFAKGTDLVATPPASGRIVGVTDRREVVTEIEVEVAGSGLCGLVTCARRRSVPLPRPLAVGPRPIAPPHAFPEVFGAWGEGAPRPAPVGDVVRGVRDYVPGDPVRRVHWPSSARRGDLVVKEVEEPGAPRLVVSLDLGGGGAAGEAAAARAAWYAYEALRRGYEVVLATAEPAGPVTGPGGRSDQLARGSRPVTGPGGRSDQLARGSRPVTGPGGRSDQLARGSRPVTGPGGRSDQLSRGSRPVTGRVGPPTDVNQRLARAVRGKPHVPAGGPTRGAVVTVTPEGDSWPQ